MKRAGLLFFTYAFMIALLSACGSNDVTSARIFERQQIDSNRLMIKYHYTVDDKEYTDSATIDNTVLHHDTITVRVDKSNPTESTPDLKK